MAKPTIKFKAESTTTVGSVIRYLGRNGKFWKVKKIENGIATAYAVPGPKTGCC